MARVTVLLAVVGVVPPLVLTPTPLSSPAPSLGGLCAPTLSLTLLIVLRLKGFVDEGTGGLAHFELEIHRIADLS